MEPKLVDPLNKPKLQLLRERLLQLKCRHLLGKSLHKNTAGKSSPFCDLFDKPAGTGTNDNTFLDFLREKLDSRSQLAKQNALLWNLVKFAMARV